MLHRFLAPTLLLLASCPASAVSPDEPATSSTTDDLTAADPPDTTPTTGATAMTSDAPGSGESTTTVDDTTDTTSQPEGSTGSTGGSGGSGGCGDGELDPGETCDEGHGTNSNFGACLLSCQRNVCGDGYVELGVEFCDNANDNNDFLYDACSTRCTRTSYCGDGELNGPEECDRGKNNGTNDKDADAVPCSSSCTLDASLVFLSSRTYTVFELGGGAYEADMRCEELAAAAMLPNHKNFRAWISDQFSSPFDRFSEPVPGLAYALKNGLRVADDRAQLLATGPLTGITITETGATIYKAFVWTATKPNGTLFDDTLDCENWKSNSPLKKARVGFSGVDKQDVDAWNKWKSEQQWTSALTMSCDGFYHIYCVEQ